MITSDHGIGYAPQNFVNDRQTPAGALSIVAGKSKALLIVKTPGSRGPVRVSNAPTTISDVAATVLDAAGIPRTLPGEPALKLAEDAQRVRGFGMYDWEDDGWKQPYFDALDVLEIRGPAVDGNSWRLVDSLYPPDVDADKRTRGVHEVQRSRSGFQYRWSSPHGFFHAPPQARSFEIEIRSIAPKPQTVTFAAAGRVLDTITLSDHEWVTVKGALPSPATPATNWLELHVDLPWRPRGKRASWASRRATSSSAPEPWYDCPALMLSPEATRGVAPRRHASRAPGRRSLARVSANSSSRCPRAASHLARRRLDSLCRRDPEFPAAVVWTIYYDTPALVSLGEKINSDYLKRKIRVRWYSDLEGRVSGPAFVEAKLRLGTAAIESARAPSLSGRRDCPVGSAGSAAARIPAAAEG